MSHPMLKLGFAGALALAGSLAAAADPAAPHTYRVTDVLIGSLVPQNIIEGPLPFDATYAALTPEQKAVLFSDYESLGAGDEPPYPLYGIRHLVKPLVPLIETYDITGSVLAAVKVDSRGNGVDVTVYQSPDPQVSRLVTASLLFDKYKPARCNGQPCSMQFVLRADFPVRRANPVTTLALQPADVPSAMTTRH